MHNKESDILHGLILSLGRQEYSVSELRELGNPFGITDSSLRTFLSRRVRQGFLTSRREGRRAFYSLSDKGKRIVSNVGRSFRTPDWSGWDGFWYGFIFSVPEDRKPERHRIRTKLEAYRFAAWYNGFWIRPKHPDEPVQEQFGSNKHSKLIVFREISETPAEEIRELWGVEGIQAEYITALKDLNCLSGNMELYSPEKPHIKRIEVGDRIVTLLSKDPLLPPVYLPENWAGEKLKKAFFEWDEKIQKIARAFWDEIFDKE